MIVDIEKVKVNDRIRKDFGNIEELAQDIKENGLINPPVVTPDFQLIAGERRLRACNALGWQQIEVRVMTVKDRLQYKRIEVNENALRKDFTFTEMMDAARELERLERIAADERKKTTQFGSNVVVQNFAYPEGKTRDIVAEHVGLGSGEQYRKAKFIVDNADDETIAKLDDGEISIHKAYMETKVKLEEEVKKREQAEQRAELAESKPPKIVEKKVVIDNTDYETINRLRDELESKDKEKHLLERKLTLQQDDINEVARIKKELSDLTQKRDDIERQIESALTLSSLYVEIEHFLANKLAPIQYSRALMERRDSPVVIENLKGIIGMVENWCDEMHQYLPKENFIDAEVVNYEQ